MSEPYIITEEDVAQIADRERTAKENYGNYECKFCRKFIWWDEPHKHKVGAKVKK